jgi:hypothetical protein
VVGLLSGHLHEKLTFRRWQVLGDCGPASLEGAIAETCRSLDDNLGRLQTQGGNSQIY